VAAAVAITAEFLKRILGGELIEDAVQKQPCPDLALMKHWQRLLGSKEATSTEIVLLEVQARLRRLALTLKSSPLRHKQTTRQETALFERMIVEIAHRYREPLQVSNVARPSVSVHTMRCTSSGRKAV